MSPEGSVDLAAVDWGRVVEASYLVQRQMRYQYPTPIDDLRHRLVVFPPTRHGDQLRLRHSLDVSNAEHWVSSGQDRFGNTVVDLLVPRVDEAIDFRAWMVVRRRPDRPHRVPAAWLDDRNLLDPSPLTMPDHPLRQVAASLIGLERDPLRLAAEISAWVHRAMTYKRGVTEVTTSASQALRLGGGVCQDYAHVMLAICRLCDIPARYVSGHLLGDGAMHAWVEVLMPSADRPGEAIAWPFDPTHDRPVSMQYLTVAVGRDYADVSPTRGTFRASTGGSLSSRQSVSLTAIRYD